MRSEHFSVGIFHRVSTCVILYFQNIKGEIGQKKKKRVNVTEIEFEEMWRSFRATLAIDFLFFLLFRNGR